MMNRTIFLISLRSTSRMLMISAMEKPLACWQGKDRVEDQQLECLTIIFKSAGCSWSKCRMCSYRHERYQSRQTADELTSHLRGQLAWVLSQYPADTYQMVKIFTSGSFFDPDEVPPSFVDDVASAFAGKLVIAETRPEFVSEERIRKFVEIIDTGKRKFPLYCAIGLETTNDAIRDKSINKGFKSADFFDASRKAHTAGAGIKAYLLFKPLFVTEEEAITDMKHSIVECSRHADLVSMNPCTVQRNTELEYYWKRGAYRPPYLWSVLEILRDAPIHVTCDPFGGGQARGPHNCKACDYEIVRGIRDYSLNGDRDLIQALLDTECGCKEEWKFVRERERPYAMPLTS